MPTSRPSEISSSELSVSPTSRSAVWSSAARRLIRSSAARSIRAGTPSLMLLRCGGPGRLDSKLGHEGRDIGRRECLAGWLSRPLGPWCDGHRRIKEGTEQLYRNGEDRGGVVLRRNLGDGLEIA